MTDNPIPERIGQLPANDVDAALAWLERQIKRAGKIDPDDAASLIMLQDDPDEYIRRGNELMMRYGLSP